MDDALSITLQIAVFAAVVGGVLAVVWRLEQGALIRRRMKDGPAAVQGAPACNGWQFWCVPKDGVLVPIDHYRQLLRAELH